MACYILKLKYLNDYRSCGAKGMWSVMGGGEWCVGKYLHVCMWGGQEARDCYLD